MGCKNPRPVRVDPMPSARYPGSYITTLLTRCGKCLYCIERKKQEWCFRMEVEAENSLTKYFVTLTYDSKHVPYDQYNNMILVQDDLTKFMKRLRHYHCKGDRIETVRHGLTRKHKIKSFACGEYGSQRGRPHFHLMIFNAAWRDIEKAWTFGNVHCVAADTAGAAAYVMKYMDKQLSYSDSWKKPKEFTTQSEGIGYAYVEKMKGWHKANLDVNYTVSMTGALIPMSRYYRQMIFTEDELKKQSAYVSEIVQLQEEHDVKSLGRKGFIEKNLSQERIRILKFNRSYRDRSID